MSIPIIIHPCFQECQYFTLDQYWKDIFFSCACNKFPKGIRYDSSTKTIFIRTPTSGGKSKVEAIDIPEKCEEAFFTMMKIFKEKLGMFSAYDLQIKKEEIEHIQLQRKVDMDCDWNKLKPRSIKEQLIINYVSKLKEEHKLSPKEAKKLLLKIQLGFNLKELTSENVNYSEREIQSIEGIKFDSKKGEWIITNEPKKVCKTEKQIISQKFNQSVDKFIRDYKNKKLKL